jgi:hypothetical protein
MGKQKENVVVIEASNPAKPEPASEQAKAKSSVDVLFDTFTVQAARGLVAAQNALLAVARWLDGQAKVVGDLATKLSTPSGEPSAPAPTAPESPAAS